MLKHELVETAESLSGLRRSRPIRTRPQANNDVKREGAAREVSSVHETLKISAVATIAAMLAWWLGFAQRIWPAHPAFADFLLALICVSSFSLPVRLRIETQGVKFVRTN